MTTPHINATNVYIAQALFPASSARSATTSRATYVPSPEQRCRAISENSVQCRREKVPNTYTPWDGRQSRLSRLMAQLCKQHKVKAQGFLEAIFPDWKLLNPSPWLLEQMPESVQVAKVAARLCESQDGKMNDLLTAIEEDELAQLETKNTHFIQASPSIGTAGLDVGKNNIKDLKGGRYWPGLRWNSDKEWSSAVNDGGDNGQARDCRELLINTAVIIGPYLSPSGNESSGGNQKAKGKQHLTNDELDQEEDVKILTTELHKLVALDSAYTQALERVASSF